MSGLRMRQAVHLYYLHLILLTAKHGPCWTLLSAADEATFVGQQIDLQCNTRGFDDDRNSCTKNHYAVTD
jgi:hypothetical protein